ncbi:MAG TPA: thiamine phosphate synthase [Thermoanaerobaculia bacterium]|nr:thiamine phosphate synthase [Thermoanaerobaculia bacterium]
MKSFAIAATDEAPDDHFYARVAELVAAGVDFVLLRDGLCDDVDRLESASCIRALVEPPTKFLVHGRADIAMVAQADGVHLPADGIPAGRIRSLSPDFVIGRSCHSVAACRAAKEEGCDYVLLGPVFQPRSKEGESRITRSDLLEAGNTGIAVYALGGISIDNLSMLTGLPIEGIAGITLFMKDEPVAEVVRQIAAAGQR